MRGAQWAVPGKQDWRCGSNQTPGYGARVPPNVYQKRCPRIKTAGLWPWKSASAKECVTTHRPNVGALKMDGAE